jgi:hypothetical protein
MDNSGKKITGVYPDLSTTGKLIYDFILATQQDNGEINVEEFYTCSQNFGETIINDFLPETLVCVIPQEFVFTKIRKVNHNIPKENVPQITRSEITQSFPWTWNELITGYKLIGSGSRRTNKEYKVRMMAVPKKSIQDLFPFLPNLEGLTTEFVSQGEAFSKLYNPSQSGEVIVGFDIGKTKAQVYFLRKGEVYAVSTINQRAQNPVNQKDLVEKIREDLVEKLTIPSKMGLEKPMKGISPNSEEIIQILEEITNLQIKKCSLPEQYDFPEQGLKYSIGGILALPNCVHLS